MFQLVYCFSFINVHLLTAVKKRKTFALKLSAPPVIGEYSILLNLEYYFKLDSNSRSRGAIDSPPSTPQTPSPM